MQPLLTSPRSMPPSLCSLSTTGAGPHLAALSTSCCVVERVTVDGVIPVTRVDRVCSVVFFRRQRPLFVRRWVLSRDRAARRPAPLGHWDCRTTSYHRLCSANVRRRWLTNQPNLSTLASLHSHAVLLTPDKRPTLIVTALHLVADGWNGLHTTRSQVVQAVRHQPLPVMLMPESGRS